MSEEIVFSDLLKATTTIGLLGCDVSDIAERGVTSTEYNARRFEEIERRILQIEGWLQAISNLVQP